MAESYQPSVNQAIESAKVKLRRLLAVGLDLSRNDRRLVLFGQLLTTIRSPEDAEQFVIHAETDLEIIEPAIPAISPSVQLYLFD